VLTWDDEPIPKIIDGKETYPNARRPERPTAEFIVGNPGWIRPLILQKSGGQQGSFAYLADCADPVGGCVFVMNEFGSGGSAAVAATNGLIGQLAPS
jgi:hypothetical protein